MWPERESEVKFAASAANFRLLHLGRFLALIYQKTRYFPNGQNYLTPRGSILHPSTGPQQPYNNIMAKTDFAHLLGVNPTNVRQNYGGRRVAT